MVKLFVFIFLIVACIPAKAQFVSLSGSEIKTLASAIKTDDKVRAVFEPIKNTAKKALNAAPNPIEKITSQGLLAGNPAKTASLKAADDAPKIYALALYFRLYNNVSYLNKAVEYLTAWAKINKPTGDPIDGTKLEDLISGYDLVRDGVDEQKRAEIDAWLNKFADEQIRSESIKAGKSTAINNWNSHRLKVITFIAYTLHNKTYEQYVLDEIEKQIGQNLFADGSGFDFKQRDALHYHVYTLEPLLKAIIVINRSTGKNYYTFQSKSQASIQRSVQFLVPFVTGEKTHVEFLNSTVKFDRDRAANREKGYEPANFVPKSGVVVLCLASYFDPSLQDIIKKVNGDDYNDWQLVLNNVRKPIK
ncbi:alginate lyase family protein [Mucilaginibacter sp. UYCu711]|uniref:alginate lyase family protein n=1 Tax=Mucilaginibacter sp. UYCu711 TaxID=3156339 RepID=UPI003D225319